MVGFFYKIDAGYTVYMYAADLIQALRKHVDLSYSMDLFVSKVVCEILLLFVVGFIPKVYIFGSKILRFYYFFTCSASDKVEL